MKMDSIYFDDRWDWGWSSAWNYNIGVDVTNDGFIEPKRLVEVLDMGEWDAELTQREEDIIFVHVNEKNVIDFQLTMREARRIVKLSEL